MSSPSACIVVVPEALSRAAEAAGIDVSGYAPRRALPKMPLVGVSKRNQRDSAGCSTS